MRSPWVTTQVISNTPLAVDITSSMSFRKRESEHDAEEINLDNCPRKRHFYIQPAMVDQFAFVAGLAGMSAERRTDNALKRKQRINDDYED